MQSYRKSVVHIVILLAFLPTRKSMVWRVDLPVGSWVPEEGEPTFAKGCLGIGSHRVVKKELGLALCM